MKRIFKFTLKLAVYAIVYAACDHYIRSTINKELTNND